jgi:hypothetical protein
MAYVPPTVAEFKAAFPSFVDVPDAQVQFALDEAQLYVDDCWIEEFRRPAVMLYAAHALTLQGLGTGAESQAAAQGASDMRRIKSGGFELERASSASSGGTGAVPDPWGMTSYGRQFYALLRRNRGGPFVV